MLLSIFSRKRGMAMPIVLIVIMLLAVLVIGSMMTSRTQYRHTNIAKERIMATYISEAGHNAILATINTLTWNGNWGSGWKNEWKDRHEVEIEKDLKLSQDETEKFKFIVFIKDVPDNSNPVRLSHIDVYSKGFFGNTVRLYYQKVCLTVKGMDVGPLYDHSDPAGTVIDMKSTQRHEITSRDLADEDAVETSIEKLDLSEQAVREKIIQVVSKKEVEKKENYRSNSGSTSSSGSTSTASSSGNTNEDIYENDLLRKVIRRDKLRLIPVTDRPPLSVEETEQILVGSPTGRNGMFGFNMLQDQTPREVLPEVSQTRVEYNIGTVNAETGDEESARVDVTVPTRAQWTNNNGDDVIGSLFSNLNTIFKSIETINNEVNTMAAAPPFDRDVTIEDLAGFQPEADQDEGGDRYTISIDRGGYALGATDTIAGIIGSGADRRQTPPPWASTMSPMTLPIQNGIVSIPDNIIRGPVDVPNDIVPPVAIASAQPQVSLAEAAQLVDQLLANGTITPEQADRAQQQIATTGTMPASINGMISGGSTGQTGMDPGDSPTGIIPGNYTGPIPGGTLGIENWNPNNLNYCPVPEDGSTPPAEDPPGFFETWLPNVLGPLAGGTAAVGTVAVMPMGMGPSMMGPIYQTFNEATQRAAQGWGEAMDDAVGAAGDAIISGVGNAAETIAGGLGNAADAISSWGQSITGLLGGGDNSP